MNDLAIGSRWLEVNTNKVIIILGGNKEWWYYEDDINKTPWYCCIEDFFIWERFREL